MPDNAPPSMEIKTNYFRDWMATDWVELCNRSGLEPSEHTLILKNRNRRNGTILSCPSGMMYYDHGIIRCSVGPHTSRLDYRHVIAHEIGHLLQWTLTGSTDEHGANIHAVLLGCIPKHNYGLKR